MSATQRLTLFGGTMRTVHNQQVIAATTLRRYVYQEMGVEQEEHGRPPSQIQFVRSVFEKVCEHSICADTGHRTEYD